MSDATGHAGDWTPRPDPTILTTEQLQRAIDAVTVYVDGQVQVIDGRLEAMDRATTVRLQAIHDILPTVDEKVAQLADNTKVRFESYDRLTLEKFNSVGQQFRERDTRSERESRDNKTAVDAAFSAQKEAAAKQDEANAKAIAKSEAATAETIRNLATLLTSTAIGSDSKISDLKDRIATLETTVYGLIQSNSGVAASIRDRREGITNVNQAVSIVVAIISVAVAVIVGIAYAVKK